MSLCENSKLPRFCSARLQAGTLESSTCPPEGGRYMNRNRDRTRTLQPLAVRARLRHGANRQRLKPVCSFPADVTAEAVTYKTYSQNS